MNWPAIVAAIALLTSLAAGWMAMSMRAERAELLVKIQEMLANLNADIRRDINGSYMRSKEAEKSFDGLRNEIRARFDAVHDAITGIARMERK